MLSLSILQDKFIYVACEIFVSIAIHKNMHNVL